MGFFSFFYTTCETRELHSDPDLRTRYYRNNFKQCLEGIQKYADEHKVDVRNVNPDHGEVYLLGNGFDCIITVIQLTPIESGVDIKVNYFSLIGFGRPKKLAVGLFKYLDSVLKFKGVALHP